MRRIAEGCDWGFAPVLQPENLFPKRFPTRISYQSNYRFGSFCRDRLEVVVGAHSIAQHYYRFGFLKSKKYLKITDFIGVAVEIRDVYVDEASQFHDTDHEPVDADGPVSVTLYLLNEDSVNDVLLYQADHEDDILALWQFWSKRLKLPMLSVSVDGEITEPLNLMGFVALGESCPRPPITYLSGRKPIFLRVRDIGCEEDAKRLSGREIMARD